MLAQRCLRSVPPGDILDLPDEVSPPIGGVDGCTELYPDHDVAPVGVHPAVHLVVAVGFLAVGHGTGQSPQWQVILAFYLGVQQVAGVRVQKSRAGVSSQGAQRAVDVSQTAGVGAAPKPACGCRGGSAAQLFSTLLAATIQQSCHHGPGILALVAGPQDAEIADRAHQNVRGHTRVKLATRGGSFDQ